MTFSKKIFSTLTIMAMAFLVVPLAVEAQVQQQQQELPERPDREELVDFVKGMLDVAEIQEEMEEQLGNVETAEEANQIQQQANAQMVAALEEYEMTPERYSEIAMLLNVDQELNEEFQEVHEEILEERDGPGLIR